MDDLEREPLELPTSLERLDQTLRIVGIKGWAIISALLVLMALSIGWAIFGTIPIAVSGKSIAFDPSATYRIQAAQNGVVKSVGVSLGQTVKQGTSLATLEGGEPILAPIDGAVISIDVTEGEVISRGHTVFWMEKEVNPEQLKIFVFIPVFSGQQIVRGMEALTDLDVVDAARYGRIFGTVEEIVPYPVDPTDLYLQKIPSRSLREYLIQGPVPSVMVIVNPEKDPNSPSGLKWSSQVTPPIAVPPGTTGETLITLDNVRPITYLIPKIRRKG